MNSINDLRQDLSMAGYSFVRSGRGPNRILSMYQFPEIEVQYINSKGPSVILWKSDGRSLDYPVRTTIADLISDIDDAKRLTTAQGGIHA